MRVSRPTITENGAEICVSARVEVNSAKSKLPDELWFRFPIDYKEYVTEQLNGFAVALLPLAMTLGEDLHIEGVLSPRLLRGMEEYQRIQCAWKPTTLRPVKIEYDQLQAAELMAQKSGVGSSFSAGIDSFDTLWRHLPENEPIREYRITHTLMINGFDADTDINNEGHFLGIQKVIEPMMERHGIELIICRTNYGYFSDPNILKPCFGAMITAPALVLGRLFSCFFVPSSYRFDEFFRDGSHLMIDHLMSTESMETIHEGSYLQRPQKTANVAGWSETYPLLRVCFNKTGYRDDTASIANCSRCEKCVRTMTTLKILGKLDKYTTFSKTPGHLDVWKCYYGHKGSRIHAREVMALAWKSGKLGIWIDYCIAISVSLITQIPRQSFRRIHLFLEERSEFYAVTIRRLFPRLRRRAYWIR